MKLSIAIPIYNGEEFLAETLSAMTSQIENRDVEIVLCDDNSTDRTIEIAKNYAEKFECIKFYQNEQNLGMDGNFEKVADLATGEFVWFSGQDDFFGEGAIAKVLEVINQNDDVNFVHMNFSQNSHNLDKPIRERMIEIDEDKKIDNYADYIDFVGLDKLPSFLPAFIMKKSLWDSVKDKKKFYQSCFVQLGVFFEVCKELNFYIIAHPFIKGRIPDNGWQANNARLLDVLSGDMEILDYATKTLEVVPVQTYQNHYKSRRKWIFNTLIAAKADNQSTKSHVKARFKKILTKKDYAITNIIDGVPNNLCQFKPMRKMLKLLR